MRFFSSGHFGVWIAALVCVANVHLSANDERIDFNRDVRPILSDNCFSCHGFDESSREAGLRLDTRVGATSDLGGYSAIVPGNPEQSELISRITTEDADLLMPPAGTHKKKLDPTKVNVLRQWIRQGATWGQHWAFDPPKAKAIPQTATHPVDYFVKRRLDDVGRKFAPAAATHTLARRLSFDLTGLPPVFDDVAGLSPNPTRQQLEQWIDKLLDSPHFGERMAMWWLDGARYSDTDGFQQDATRQNWPWRDWVVKSFNENLPFDEFTVQQFAGDLLPGSTDEQKLATCFHRNHMHNGEGGRDPAESRVDYVIDRTNTMGTLWLGLTLGCTQCHDHKFDPISQKDYYALTAYFNSINEDGKAGNGAKPFLKYRSSYASRTVRHSEDLVEQTKSILRDVKSKSLPEFNVALDQMIERARDNFEPWRQVLPSILRSTEGTELLASNDSIVVSKNSRLAQDDYFFTVSNSGLDRITGIRLEVFSDPGHNDGKYSFAESGEFVLTNVKLHIRHVGSNEVDEIALVRAIASSEGVGKDNKYGKVNGTLDDDPRTGWTTRTKPVEPVQIVVFELDKPLEISEGILPEVVLMQRSLAQGELIGRFRISITDQRGPAVRSLGPMPMEALKAAINVHVANSDQPFGTSNVSQSLKDKLHDQYLEDYPPWRAAMVRHRKATQQLSDAKKAAGNLNVTVLEERDQPRETYVLERGVWDQHGEIVTAGVLSTVLPVRASEVPTRLELAQWIVARDNPLTARVITNQVWQLFFGAGLVRTPNDFGVQGESPTHPELLDWLAVDFMEHGWDLKHLVRRIVTSQTYQQDSRVSPELLELDPENRWLARGARFRLPSWMIRDASLQYSGLLNPEIGGPPMFAYQPPGVWHDQFMGRFNYQPTIGPEQYRRTIYTFWRRSSAPTFLFDSAMRRSCEVLPRRTNTPLHALTLLNDTTSLESARSLAEHGLKSTQYVRPNIRLKQMFQSVLSREPSTFESRILTREYERARIFYELNRREALLFTSVGQSTPPLEEHASELAAAMLVASMILNLDESITHE